MAALALGTISCGRGPALSASAPQTDARSDEVVAELDGAKITRAEIAERATGALTALRQQEYEIQRNALEEILSERLLEREATSRGITVQQLIKAEIDDKVPHPSATEVELTYLQNAARLVGRKKEDVIPLIEKQLHAQRLGERHREFEGSLRKKASLQVFLQEPRVTVAIPASAPARGPAEAPVTVVEFLDYQCPACRQAAPLLETTLGQYGSKVRFVHRDFPLDFHAAAVPASRAAHCAGEQGRFWEYHRLLFSGTGDLGPEDLKKRAAGLGIEPASFAKCLDSDRYRAEITASITEGRRVGVDATPTFFVNGLKVVGSRPEKLQEQIDSEIARASQKRAF